MDGQVCLHFTNSKTHGGKKVDGYHKEAIELTVTFRVIGQAVASGHMKEHGMVASDYAIKLINLMYPCDMSKVIEERQWQLSKYCF